MLPNDMGWLVGVASILVNLFLLVLNLKVSGAIAEVKLEVEKLRTEMAEQRGEAAERQLKNYQELMNNLRGDYVSVKEAERMHDDNQRRLTAIEKQLMTMRGGTD